MISLKDSDYLKCLDSQPLSRAEMEALQKKAWDGDEADRERFRDQMMALGAYVASREADARGLNRDDLFSHICADELVDVGYQNSFSAWEGDSAHIDAVAKYVRKVIGLAYVRAGGYYIEAERYEKTRKALMQDPGLSGIRNPTLQQLHAEGITDDMILAVKRNEERKTKEKVRFRRLKVKVRGDDSLSYKNKVDLLLGLANADKEAMDFFCCMYGVDDGIRKSFGEAAAQSGMTEDEAALYYGSMADGPLTNLVMYGCRSDITYDKRVRSMISFVCRNKKDQKEKRSELRVLRAFYRRRRRKLRDYLD